MMLWSGMMKFWLWLNEPEPPAELPHVHIRTPVHMVPSLTPAQQAQAQRDQAANAAAIEVET